jgi:hypothetical protein
MATNDKKKKADDDDDFDSESVDILAILEELEKNPLNLPNIDPEDHRLYRIYGESIPESGNE